MTTLEPLFMEQIERVAKHLLERGFKPPFALFSSLPLPKTIEVSSGVFKCYKDDEIPKSQRTADTAESMIYATSMEAYKLFRKQNAALRQWGKK